MTFDQDWVVDLTTRGFTVLKGVLPAGEVDYLRGVVGGELERRGRADSAVGTDKAKELTQLLFASARTARIVRDLYFEPRVQWILGAFHARPVIEHTKVLIKGARAPETPWHQDHAFFHGFDPTGTMLTLWSPLHGVSADNGGLRLLAGEPPRQLLPHLVARGGEKIVEPEVLAPLLARGVVDAAVEPGDAVVFTSRVVHGTYPNPTDEARLAFKLVFQDLARRAADKPLRASRAVSFHGPGAWLNRAVPCAMTRLQIQRAQLRAGLKARFA